VVLGISELLKLVRAGLIEGLSERELKNPEGTGFDLRVGEIYKIKGKGILLQEFRKTPEIELLAKYDPSNSEKILISPFDYCLVKTIERVKTPPNLVGIIFPRTTLFRSGLTLFSSLDPPGYEGELVFGLVNLGPCQFELELGARIAHIIFLKIKGKTRLYKGQWQGGRVATRSLEKQI